MTHAIRLFASLWLFTMSLSAYGQGMYINFKDGGSKFLHLDRIESMSVDIDYTDFNPNVLCYAYITSGSMFSSGGSFDLNIGAEADLRDCVFVFAKRDNEEAEYDFSDEYELHVDDPWLKVYVHHTTEMTIVAERNDTGRMRIGTIRVTEPGKDFVYLTILMRQSASDGPEVTDFVDGYEYVDLGLPSGVLWATHNIGADSPAEHGDHFAFAETDPRDAGTFTFANYKYQMTFDDEGTVVADPLAHMYPDDKYTFTSFYPGRPDGISCSQYDAAHVKWGGRWRMPTAAEYAELLEYCYIHVTERDGCKGVEFRSHVNGNAVFFPVAGFYNEDEYRDLPYKDIYGWYWVSTTQPLLTKGWVSAFFLMPVQNQQGEITGNSYQAFVGNDLRWVGGSIRPVIRPVDNIVPPQPPVTQYHISVNPQAINSPWEGQNASINVDADCQWQAHANADWLTVDKLSDNILNINASENSEPDSRTAQVILTAIDYPAITAIVTVAQEGKPADPPVSDLYIIVNPAEVTASWEDDIVYCEVETNCQWQVTTDAEWITPSKWAICTLQLFIAENPGPDSRTAQVILTAIDNPAISAIVTVTQQGKPAVSDVYAILHHNGTQTIYYGEGALIEAYVNAVDNDMIQLSAGDFQCVNIDKTLTIYGVGWREGNPAGRTRIDGHFVIGHKSNNIKVSLRDLYHDGYLNYAPGLTELEVYGSRLYTVNPYNDDDSATHFNFVKSKVQQLFLLAPSSTARFENSFIYDPHTRGDSSIDFVHCVIFNLNNELTNSRFLDTVIDCCLTVALDPSNSISYCLSVGGNCEACFNNMDTSTSQTIPGHDIFKTFRAWGFTDEEDYQMTDEAAATYIGSDGTQIGMNGGLHPYIAN